jgi:hypothetical protein
MPHTERFNRDKISHLATRVAFQEPSVLGCMSDAAIIHEPNHSESTSFTTLGVIAEGTSCPTLQGSTTFKDIDDLHSSYSALSGVGANKAPLPSGWQLTTTNISDPKDKRQHYIGIPCGPVNNINVADCDIVKQKDIDDYERDLAN